MIYMVIGTKAQFIKMAPIMVSLERRNIPYRIVSLSQHGSMGQDMLSAFDVATDVVMPFEREQPVASIASGLVWMSKILLYTMLRPGFIRREIFSKGRGIVLVHGDTMSALLGLLLARRIGLPVGLVEAGLRSGKLFSPFPEELVRRLVERGCAMLFAPGDFEAKVLMARFPEKVVKNTGYNTGRDALTLMVGNDETEAGKGHPVVTLHRLETLTNRRRLKRLIDVVVGVAEKAGKMRFVMHPPTEKALQKYGLLATVTSSPFIECQPLERYEVFARYLAAAPFIMTDGGSIQEEASYLGKPCIVLRDQTERAHGIGQTARLTSWDVDEDWRFISDKINEVSMGSGLAAKLDASESIVDSLQVGD
jgi:UDP-N-acetylglucosamine 2-epimerase (non-hydrolysing)